MRSTLLPLLDQTRRSPRGARGANGTLWLLMGCLGVLLCGSGCNRNPYVSGAPLAGFPGVGGQAATAGVPNASMAGPGAGMHPAAAQLAELERRIRLLDDNNRQLTTQLAQSQQQMQVFRDRSDLLARQLQDANGQLSQARLAQAQFTQQVQGMQASMQARGGAKLVANNSLARQADSLRGLGFPVQIDGDVVRITLPADQLFQTGSAQLNPNAAGVLDKFADVLARQFPRQRVGIEAHTDTVTSPSSPLANPQQLSSAQSVAVYEYLTKRSAIPTNQLFSLAHGASMPVADNQNPMGRAQNRRIELVIYPETF